MTDPFNAYSLYNSLKLHFETDYDAVKYNYKTRVNPQSFFKRRDKYFFAKLAKTYDKNLGKYYIVVHFRRFAHIFTCFGRFAQNYVRFARKKVRSAFKCT